MSGGLISGLEKAERRPFSGWKTKNHGQNCSSPENDSLLDDDNEAFDQQDSPSSSDRRCLSEGHRSPKELLAVQTSYKIPKKTVLDGKLKTDSQWFDLTFEETNVSTPGKCQAVKRCENQSWRNSNKNTRRKSFDAQTSYQIKQPGNELRGFVTNGISTTYSATRSVSKVNSPSNPGQSLKNGDQPITVKQLSLKSKSPRPKSRWKYALQKTCSRFLEEPDSGQESSNHIDGKSNDSEGPNTMKMNEEKNVCSKFKLEKKQNLSALDSIMEGNSVNIFEAVDLDEDNSKIAVNTASSDSNYETRANKDDHPDSESSEELFSDNNYDDCLNNTCWKCLKKFPKGKKGRLCSKCTSPSRAATPRKHLSMGRFYSLNNQSKVKRTYITRSHENHTPVLPTGSSVTSDGECQTNCKVKKRQGTPKREKILSMSDDSDLDYKPRQKRQRRGLQQTEPQNVCLYECKGAQENLFSDGSKSAAAPVSASPAVSNVQNTTGSRERGTQDNEEPSDCTVQTRKKRHDKPVSTSSEPVKPDILLHHNEMESHITLLAQHSKEQKENLQQHQKLLEIERDKVRKLRRTLGEEQQARLRSENELRQVRGTCSQLEESLEAVRLSSQSLQQDLETKEETITEQSRQSEQEREERTALEERFRRLQREMEGEKNMRASTERELAQERRSLLQDRANLERERDTYEQRIRDSERTALEERFRRLQREMEDERNMRASTERELAQERRSLLQDRANLERERDTYEQRIRDSERTVTESQRRLHELQSAVSVAQEAVAVMRFS